MEFLPGGDERLSSALLTDAGTFIDWIRIWFLFQHLETVIAACQELMSSEKLTTFIEVRKIVHVPDPSFYRHFMYIYLN